MSDLGNRGWPNSMKLGENIDLDELLLDQVLFVFVLSSFCFFRGVLFWGLLLLTSLSGAISGQRKEGRKEGSSLHVYKE